MAFYEVNSGETLSNTVLNENDSMYIYSRGRALKTTVNSGALVRVFTSGQLSFAEVNNGSVYASTGSVTSLTLNGGLLSLSGGADTGMETNKITLNSGGTMYADFVRMIQISINSGATAHIKNSASFGGTVNGGLLILSSGGLAEGGGRIRHLFRRFRARALGRPFPRCQHQCGRHT